MGAPQQLDQEAKPSYLRVYTFLFHVSWIVILGFAAWRRFSLPAPPLADRDIWGYLSPALAKLVGDPFTQSEGRAFVYPGFLYLLLRAFHSLNAVTVAQHILGLGTGLLFLANWRTARRLFPCSPIPAFAHDLFGLVLLAIFLLCGQSTFSEHHLRPEGIAPFFAILGFGFIIRFLLAKYVDAQPTRALWYGGASIAVAFFIPLLKPSYSLTAILTTLPVWWHLFDRREKFLRRFAMAVIPMCAAWLLLWMPNERYAENDARRLTFLPASLFTIHAPQIRTQLANDLAANDPAVPYSHEQLQSILTLLDHEIELSRPTVRHGFAPLGFNPDYLLYEDSFCRKLADILHTRPERAAFYHFYFRRTWRQQPGAMLHKVGAQLALFYNLNCPVYEHGSGTMARTYAETAEFLSEPNRFPLVARVPAAAQYVATLHAFDGAKSDTHRHKFLNKVVMPFLASSYLPGMLLALLTIGWILADAELRATCGLFAVVVAVGYAYNLGNNVAIALFHTLGVGRYSHVQLVTTLFTQGLSLWMLVEVVVHKLAHVRLPVELPDQRAATS
ncbi:hypothetical protein CfE428DRAFT_3606 [Chthoniobacter flavus Ellin428]|uniref:Glycosyltransferase RgtA/B/C/D-like domain-containing protein n=1 Tax=Chthoniobacter flavus Ellin428 TaxID=497964 RepID=B4D3W8_9BACT|nr:hypothetical protein [Chthoniobacter flavus]EDY18948.1 hypothetical protein CfE428DRAFT_3606 [Chthoniobacter flavus Ellin428]TCO93533.1 hypothetical protein EV701_104237 [Chthoniobacter flavus]